MFFHGTDIFIHKCTFKCISFFGDNFKIFEDFFSAFSFFFSFRRRINWDSDVTFEIVFVRISSYHTLQEKGPAVIQSMYIWSNVAAEMVFKMHHKISWIVIQFVVKYIFHILSYPIQKIEYIYKNRNPFNWFTSTVRWVRAIQNVCIPHQDHCLYGVYGENETIEIDLF